MQKAQKLTDEEVDRGIRYSVRDAAAISARDSIFSNFSIPFALALGAGAEAIGLLTALPQLATSLLAPFIGNIIENAKSRKDLCRFTLILSNLLWLPVALLPLLTLAGKEALWAFILLFTAVQVVRNVGSISWSAWIADIIPEKIRGKFFAKRNRAASAVALCATLFGGWLLGAADGGTGFTILFLIAIAAGAASYFFLGKSPDVKKEDGEQKFVFKFSKIPKIFRENHNFRDYTMMAVLFNFAVYLASPFFAVYMLTKMNIGYQWFAVVLALEALATILTQPYWGKLADRFGDRPIMFVCGLMVSLYPAFWFFITDPWQILFAATFSGIAWAGFDIVSFNYLLDVTPDKHRHFYICDFRMLSNFGIVAGPIAGGILAVVFANTTFLWLAGLQLVFLLSLILRSATMLGFMHRLKEVRVKKHYHIRNVLWKVVAVYPLKGAMHDVEAVFHALHKMEHGIAHEERTLMKGLKAV